MEGGITEHDDDAEKDITAFKPCLVDENECEIDMPDKDDKIALQHLALHLPSMPHRCKACYLAKKKKIHSRRRLLSGVTVTSADGETYPFGARAHMDHIVMEHGSRAAKSAKCALLIKDEKTKFISVYPSNDRLANTVVNCIRLFEGVEPDQRLRRIWTDNAPEFSAASKVIRSQRPFAHFTSVPYRPQSNGIAERAIQLVMQRTRSALITSGFSETWWPIAMSFWTTMYDAFHPDEEGKTAWLKRFASDPPFKLYPFGSLVLVRPPTKNKSKWAPRLAAHVLVSIGVSPGCVWDSTYGIIKLERLLGVHRATRACIRRTCDIVFPELVSFPLKQRLTLHGAIKDADLPEPAIVDNDEEWRTLESEFSGEDCIEHSEGVLAENAPNLIQGDIHEAVALDPEKDACSSSDLEAEQYSIVNPDLECIKSLDAAKDGEVAVEGNKAPKGWGIDRFGYRTISTPPWSLRPPTMEPELWLCFNKVQKQFFRDKWAAESPEQFARQEERRKEYDALKHAGKVVGVNVLRNLRPESGEACRTCDAPLIIDPAVSVTGYSPAALTVTEGRDFAISAVARPKC